jgi:hypothetical protein
MQDITIAGHVPDPGTLVLFCKTCEGFEMIPVNAKQARVPVETNYTNIPTPPREPVQAPPKQVKQKPEEKKKPEPVKKEKPKKEEKPVPEVKPTEDLSQTKEAVQKPEEPEQTEVDCPWAVLFGEYRSEAEAQKFKILLEKENFPPVKIVENDYTGVLTYRLLCNCYRDRKKAISELPKIMDKLKALGSQEPRIIKTGD